MTKAVSYLIFMTLNFISMAVYSQSTEYSILSIPDTMRKDANAVVRSDEVTLEIKDYYRARYSEDKVISILNPTAENLAFIQIPYDQKQIISGFQAWLFDASGNLVKEFDKRDGQDYSGNGLDEITDTRVKIWNLKAMRPPYTIRYAYEIELKSTFILPGWRPAEEEKTGIQHAKFNLISVHEVPLDFAVHGVAQVTKKENYFSWEVKNFLPIADEVYSTDLSESLPRIFVMAKEFELYQVQGSSTTWNDIGKFINKLNQGRDDLGEIADPEINKILTSTEDERTKAKSLYLYLQKNFRYVSIQKGLGGWQPQNASYTLQKKFGDCKALVILMKALLKKAGIESFYTLVNTKADRIELTSGFPNSNFNHVILCVPMPVDTVWLECTSSVQPFNYLSSFTEDRNALLVYDGGARIIHTPAYTQINNNSHSISEITWNDDNTNTIKTRFTKEGELQELLRTAISDKDEKLIESVLLNAIRCDNTRINFYKIDEINLSSPSLTMELELSNQHTISRSPMRIFLRTDIFKPIRSVPERKETRSQPVRVETGFRALDTLIYHIPAGYEPENFKPNDLQEMNSPYGNVKFSVGYSPDSGEIRIYRSFGLNEGTYPAEKYSAFRDFLSKSIKVYCSDLVLKKLG